MADEKYFFEHMKMKIRSPKTTFGFLSFFPSSFGDGGGEGVLIHKDQLKRVVLERSFQLLGKVSV